MRPALILGSALLALGLAGAATAQEGFRVWLPGFGDAESTPRLRATHAPAAPPVHRAARRIWASAPRRPLRIALARPAPRPAPSPRAAKVANSPALVFLPPPHRPPAVSILADRTLRRGDAVMMADGVHVFRGAESLPYAPRDFAPLRRVAGIGWRLRTTLNALDHNPPTRWTAIMIPPA